MPPPSRASPSPALRNAAAQLAKEIAVVRLHSRVLAWLKIHARAKEPWAIAVSGGADSVALLFLLWAHFSPARKRMTVLHYDHAMRPDSADDAKFVCALAKALGVKCQTARRLSTGAKGKAASEADLREARWAFFCERLKGAGGRIIFLGQQQDDIAETMLMRLARGSGARGLSAPRPVNVFADGVVALRPLLDLGGEELRTALRAADICWREDASNATDAYLRNRVRHQVVPAWRAAVGERDLAAGVARSRALLEEDDEALQAIANATSAKFLLGDPLKLVGLAGQSRSVWRRTLRRWLEAQSLGKNISAAAFDSLQVALMAGERGRWSAGRGRWVEVRDGSLRARRGRAGGAAWRAVNLVLGKKMRIATGAALQCTVIEHPAIIVEALKNGRLEPHRHACVALWESEAAPTLRARPRQPGDRYQPLGAPGRRKLQDLFTDKKIPVEERNVLPVVCSPDGALLWVPGLPPAESRRVQPGTRRALWLTYYPSNRIM